MFFFIFCQIFFIKWRKTLSWKFTDESSIKYLWIHKWGRWIRPNSEMVIVNIFCEKDFAWGILLNHHCWEVLVQPVFCFCFFFQVMFVLQMGCKYTENKKRAVQYLFCIRGILYRSSMYRGLKSKKVQFLRQAAFFVSTFF